MIYNKLLFVGVCISGIGFSQDYLWPVKAEKALTAVFGEERPGRYHTGIDIRTFSEIGYPLVAIENGYISRIQTSSIKYGKTIYLQLEDGYTIVYAHLDHFTPELDNLASSLHQYHQKYTIDHILTANKYSVKKGEVIGYSGDTGGVSGPHLHFEIRDKNQQPLNPFNFGLSLDDTIPPIVNSLAIIPLDKNSIINGFSEYKIFPLHKINDNKYVLSDTLSIQGSVGFAIKTHDRITGQEFNFGIYNLTLFQNDTLIYSMEYDKIMWKESKSLYTEKNYSLARKGYGKYYHLFSHHQNQSLTFINNKSRSLINSNSVDFQKIHIKVNDYAKNEVNIQAIFSSDTIPKFDYSVHFINDTCFIKFNTEELYKPFFNIKSRYGSDYSQPANFQTIGSDLFVISELESPLDVIEIFATNEMGIKSTPTYHKPIDSYQRKITGKLSLNHYEHGISIQFVENEMSGMEPFLTLEKNGTINAYKLFMKSPNIYTSKIFSPMEMNEIEEIKVLYDLTDPIEVVKMNHWGNIVYPDSTFNFSLINDELLISGKEHTFYDTVHMWAEPVDVRSPETGLLISNIYKIQPNLIPFNKEVELQISINNNSFPENISIYFYSEKDDTWNYMPSELNSDSTYIKTNIFSGETFAVIKEMEPPVLSSFIPEINGTYYSSDLKHISFYIKDSLSGINGETDVYMELDGKRVIFEYNSYQKKIRYPLKYNLSEGEHLLYIKAKDRVGNTFITNGSFFIK